MTCAGVGGDTPPPEKELTGRRRAVLRTGRRRDGGGRSPRPRAAPRTHERGEADTVAAEVVGPRVRAPRRLDGVVCGPNDKEEKEEGESKRNNKREAGRISPSHLVRLEDRLDAAEGREAPPRRVDSCSEVLHAGFVCVLAGGRPEAIQI